MAEPEHLGGASLARDAATAYTGRKLGVQRFEPIREIRVRGAAEHNLKSVDVDIPRDRLVVITGLSGSGKSSLAFDTIFAEGQRKYMESLSAYARQFLDQMKKPAIDSIEGLPPTIAIEQRTTSANPRSTVATSTEIYDYLRLLFARAGSPVCWEPMTHGKDGSVRSRCEAPITATSPSEIGRRIAAQPEGSKLMVLAPVVQDKKGYHRDVAESLVKQGYIRARVDGKIISLDDALLNEGDNPLGLGRYEKHRIEAVVDRLVVKPSVRERLAEAVEAALKLAGGLVILTIQEGKAWKDSIYSEHHACSIHPERALAELEPRVFSFNAHQGACPQCLGLGAVLEFDPERILPDPDKALNKGGIAPWKRSGPAGQFSPRYIRRLCAHFGLKPSTRIGAIDEDTLTAILYGDEEDLAGWEGVIPILESWFEKTESDWAKDFLHSFQTERTCPKCQGFRLREESLSVYLSSKIPLPDAVVKARRKLGFSADPHQVNIADLTCLDIETARKVCDALELSAEGQAIAKPILQEVQARLGFLASVGLDYLSLDRRTATLSGGEAQRIRLATQVGSGIVGACYVLDEPTIGLHARDNARLIRTLRHLADIGNSVLVVEHDEEMIRAADHVIDIGPGPGVHGGEVVAQGSIEAIMAAPASLTGQYLSGQKHVPIPRRRKLSEKRAIKVVGARENNLKSVDAVFPLGGLVVVTGVSGSGKSSLVNEVLLKGVRRALGLSGDPPGAHTRINGLKKLRRVIEVDQSPIGRTPRSNPATYTSCFDDIRKLFAALPEAKARGYAPGRFSFNVKGGRCEACQGQGLKKISMHFLPDVFVKCEVCGGSRFNHETLSVRYRDKNIAEVLDMTVEEACEFFKSHPKIRKVVQRLKDVGLDYIKLGQPSTTLSGGEAQRVKLATELAKGGGAMRLADPDLQTLYILDEPTTGLHFEDVRKLISVLGQLVDQGNTVVVIEHNTEVIKSADWILDMGPEGGDGGGQLLVSGPPEVVAGFEGSHTGAAIRGLLG